MRDFLGQAQFFGSTWVQNQPGKSGLRYELRFYNPLKSKHKKRSGRYHFVLVTTAPIIAFL